MQSANFPASILSIKKAAITAATLLLTAGCAAPQAVNEAGPPSATATAAETAVAEPAATSPAQYPAVVGEDPYGDMLVIPARGAVKAGDSMPVTGGTLPPGTTVTVYGAEPMAMPSYDAANDMYHAVGDLVVITEKLTVVTDAEGKYAVELPIGATLAPQQLHIYAEASQPAANGGTAMMRTAFVE